MSYFIMKKNEETGKFEAITDDKGVREYSTINSAIVAYAPIVEWNGRGNAFVVEKVALRLNISIKPHEIDT